MESNAVAYKPLQKLVEDARDHAREILNDGVKTHQIRNFFAAVERMRRRFKKDPTDQEIMNELVMLLPKLAYSAGRQPNSVGRHFYKYFSNAIELALAERDGADETQRLREFFAYVESIIAYHKYFDKTKHKD